jgi:hypothetical protein
MTGLLPIRRKELLMNPHLFSIWVWVVLFFSLERRLALSRTYSGISTDLKWKIPAS